MQLLFQLRHDHIVDLYSWIDDIIPVDPRCVEGGRPSILRRSELVTILIWNAVVVHQKTMKDIWNFTRLHLYREFPDMPQYSTFVENCHRVAPVMFTLLQKLLSLEDAFKIVDATMLPVCKLKRAAIRLPRL